MHLRISTGFGRQLARPLWEANGDWCPSRSSKPVSRATPGWRVRFPSASALSLLALRAALLRDGWSATPTSERPSAARFRPASLRLPAPLHDKPDQRRWKGLRDRAILLTLLDTMARVSELAGVNASNVDLEGAPVPWRSWRRCHDLDGRDGGDCPIAQVIGGRAKTPHKLYC